MGVTFSVFDALAFLLPSAVQLNDINIVLFRWLLFECGDNRRAKTDLDSEKRNQQAVRAGMTDRLVQLQFITARLPSSLLVHPSSRVL